MFSRCQSIARSEQTVIEVNAYQFYTGIGQQKSLHAFNGVPIDTNYAINGRRRCIRSALTLIPLHKSILLKLIGADAAMAWNNTERERRRRENSNEMDQRLCNCNRIGWHPNGWYWVMLGLHLLHMQTWSRLIRTNPPINKHITNRLLAMIVNDADRLCTNGKQLPGEHEQMRNSLPNRMETIALCIAQGAN